MTLMTGYPRFELATRLQTLQAQDAWRAGHALPESCRLLRQGERFVFASARGCTKRRGEGDGKRE